MVKLNNSDGLYWLADKIIDIGNEFGEGRR